MSAGSTTPRATPPWSPIAVAVIAGLATAVLVRLGTGSLASPPLRDLISSNAWTQGRDLPTAAAAAARLAALALAVHLLATSTLAAAGSVLRRPGWVAAARHVTPPPLRSTIARLVGLVLSAGTLLASPVRDAGATPPAVATATLRAIDPGTAMPTPPPRTESTATLRVHPVRPGAASPEATDPTDPAEAAQKPSLAPAAGSLHRVVPGDHLWGLAEAERSSQLGRPATDAEIAPYWLRVIAANPQLLDPDLLLPGDVVTLPA